MATLNPNLSLQKLNDIEFKIVSNLASESEYEELDFFISSVGGQSSYLKNILRENGFVDFGHYIRERTANSEEKKMATGKVYGSIIGAISFLKSYSLKNNFI